MRIALLAAVKRTETGELRGEQMLAGRSVLAWQVQLARELGCERILCLCEAPRGEIIALQQHFERSGGEFHAIRSNAQLASLVRADDELVMMLDGLIVDQDAVIGALMEDGALAKTILTMAADHRLAEAHAEDFERIDRERQWAGIAAMRASKVHQLADLPPDGDAMSLLLRIGLQSRVECRLVSPDWLEDDRWLVASVGSALAEREQSLIKASAPSAGWSSPTKNVAAGIVRKIAPQWIENAAEIKGGVSLLLYLTAGALAFYGQGPIALGVVALGAFGASMAEAWLALRNALWSHGSVSPLGRYLPVVTSIAVCAVLILAMGPALPIATASMVLPVLAIGLAHYVSRSSDSAISRFFSDTPFHLMIFATAAAFGQLESALAIFALIALAQLLLRRGHS